MYTQHLLPDEPSMFGRIMSGVGYLADTPGSLTRGLLAGSPGERMSGDELLEAWGWLDDHRPGLTGRRLASIATDVVVDPLNIAGLGVISRGVRAARAAQGLGRVGAATRAGGHAARGMATPMYAASIASPIGGLGLMAANEREQNPILNYLGMGLMFAPLAYGMAKGVGKMAGKTQAPQRHGFHSRLEQALMDAPEQFKDQPARTTKALPAKTIRDKSGAVIKEIPARPETSVPGKTAHEQLMGYLSDRAHPQEIDWVLGDAFRDAKQITREQLLTAFQDGQIRLEELRYGGDPSSFSAGLSNKHRSGVDIIGEFPTRQQAARFAAKEARKNNLEFGEDFVPVVRPVYKHGPLKFPHMLIPGGKDATEVPIRLARPGGPTMFRDTKGHFGDDIVAWVIHDRRQMPNGKSAKFIQEIQSDWHQVGASKGYRGDKVSLDWKQSSHGTTTAMTNVSGTRITGYTIEELPSGLHRLHERGSGLSWIHDTLESAKEAAQDIAERWEATHGIPSVFKGNEWINLSLRRAIRDAIDAGDDYVFLPPPELVSKTQGLPAETARSLYGERIPNLLKKLIEPHGGKLQRIRKKKRPRVSVAVDATDAPGGTKKYAVKSGGKNVGVVESTPSWTVFDEIGNPVKKFNSRQEVNAYLDSGQAPPRRTVTQNDLAIVRVEGVDIHSFNRMDDAREYVRSEIHRMFDEAPSPTGSVPELTNPVPEGSLGFEITDSMRREVKQRGFPLMSLPPTIAALLGYNISRQFAQREQS